MNAISCFEYGFAGEMMNHFAFLYFYMKYFKVSAMKFLLLIMRTLLLKRYSPGSCFIMNSCS